MSLGGECNAPVKGNRSTFLFGEFSNVQKDEECDATIWIGVLLLVSYIHKQD
jgi:hypothetical protein